MESLPDKEICKNFNESEALLYLSKLIDFLEESQIGEQCYDVYNLILRISTSFYHYYNKFIDTVCEVYLKRDLVRILYFFLKNQSKLTENKSKTLELIFLIFVNFSEHDALFAETLQTSNSLNYTIDEFLKFNSSRIDEFKTDKFFKLFITIIHNFSSHSNNIVNYRVDEIKKYILQIIQLNCDDYFGIISMLTLSYLINEEEVNLLNDSVNILQKLIDKIKFTNKSPLRSDGFTLKELIHGLRCISSNDNMKDKIVDEDGLPLIFDVLKNHEDDNKIIESTLGVIEQLCFNKAITLNLTANYDLNEIVKRFSKNECYKIKKICEGILWKLENKWELVHNKLNSDENMKSKFDVFISYSWANKKKVLVIYEKLKSHNIRVWIDVEQMAGSSIEAMADGIENSNLFIIGISSSYKKSSNCRHEAEYAFNIKKKIIPLILEFRYKPSSWLGFIACSETYFEFSERRNPNEEVEKLRRAIEKRLNETSGSNSDLKESDLKEIKGKFPKEKSIPYESLKTWTNEDFNNWLDKCQMEYLKEYFIGFDGSLIQTLLEIRLNSSEYFNNSLKNEFGMSFVDVVKFHKALNDLLE